MGFSVFQPSVEDRVVQTLYLSRASITVISMAQSHLLKSLSVCLGHMQGIIP